MSRSLTAFIFARGGSKGVKNKNIRLAGGKPLIAHAITSGLESQSVSRVIVSTDSDAIAKISQDFGAEVLMRPQELATDDASELLAWRHAVDALEKQREGSKNSVFISLPATSPLRVAKDVDLAIERFEKGDCDIVFGISPSHRSPYLNMVRIDDDGLVHLVIDGCSATRRQDVPRCFDITTCVYVTSPDYIRGCSKLTEGRVGYIEIPIERALDVDTEFDLYLADLILSHPYGERS